MSDLIMRWDGDRVGHCGARDACDHVAGMNAEIERLRGLLHEAGHSFMQPHWAIDWRPILDVMAEVDVERSAERGEENER
jgi:hypothetical protein